MEEKLARLKMSWSRAEWRTKKTKSGCWNNWKRRKSKTSRRLKNCYSRHGPSQIEQEFCYRTLAGHSKISGEGFAKATDQFVGGIWWWQFKEAKAGGPVVSPEKEDRLFRRWRRLLVYFLINDILVALIRLLKSVYSDCKRLPARVLIRPSFRCSKFGVRTSKCRDSAMKKLSGGCARPSAMRKRQ